MSDVIHIVCSHCAIANRVAKPRLNDAPRCGKCHKFLFTGRPVALSESDFQKHLKRNDIPVVVDFWASWCGPCKMMAPAFEAAANKLEPKVRFAKVDTEKEVALSTKISIRSLPTLVRFKNGKGIARQAGAMSSHDIVCWVKGQL